MTNEDYFVLDTVAIIKMTRTQLSSGFVQANCRVPEEILYETQATPKANLVSSLTIPVSVPILAHAQDIFANSDLAPSVVDLYNNEGNGDILIIATILEAIEADTTRLNLFETHWTIVTDDRGLIKLATSYGIDTMPTDTFIAKVEAES